MLNGRGIGGWAAVLILSLIYAVAYVDRQILSLLVAPIRADLAISDTAFSLLHGLSFAVFYALFGIPIGWWVDRGNRPRILAAGIALWSLFTCLCGTSRSFLQLFLFRMGVGVGEATVVPVTYSLLGDYFPPERRGFAMGIFGSGIYFGMGAALLIGSAVVGAFEAAGPIDLPALGILRPWQLTMIAVGLPGLALALATLVLREPRRGPADTLAATAATHEDSPAPSRWAHYRASGAAIGMHHLAVTFMVMALYAILAWAPEHFRRSYELAAAESGLAIGVVVILSGTIGVIAGGAASDALVRRGRVSGRMLVLGAAALFAVPGSLLFALAPTSDAALAGMAVALVCLSALSSVGPAGLQDLVPARLRGFGGSIYQLVANLIGLGFGPTAVALITDYGFADDSRLAASLAIALPLMLAVAVMFALAGARPYARAAARVTD